MPVTITYVLEERPAECVLGELVRRAEEAARPPDPPELDPDPPEPDPDPPELDPDPPELDPDPPELDPDPPELDPDPPTFAPSREAPTPTKPMMLSTALTGPELNEPNPSISITSTRSPFLRFMTAGPRLSAALM